MSPLAASDLRAATLGMAGLVLLALGRILAENGDKRGLSRFCPVCRRTGRLA